jgi:glutathione S-transferase
MILIGMFDSPFVRLVAIALHLYALPFEHRNWSVGRDFDAIRRFNPLGRVPTLVLDDGEALIDSAAILDHLDELAGPQRALLPRSGPERRAALRAMAIAAGAAEKGVLQIYERVFRPQEKRHAPWVERCATQMHGALGELERLSPADAAVGVGGSPEHHGWLVAGCLTHADITASCVYGFLDEALGVDPDGALYPRLAALARRCEALPAFQAVKAEFFAPGGASAA